MATTCFLMCSTAFHRRLMFRPFSMVCSINTTSSPWCTPFTQHVFGNVVRYGMAYIAERYAGFIFGRLLSSFHTIQQVAWRLIRYR